MSFPHIDHEVFDFPKVFALPIANVQAEERRDTRNPPVLYRNFRQSGVGWVAIVVVHAGEPVRVHRLRPVLTPEGRRLLQRFLGHVQGHR